MQGSEGSLWRARPPACAAAELPEGVAFGFWKYVLALICLITQSGILDAGKCYLACLQSCQMQKQDEL